MGFADANRTTPLPNWRRRRNPGSAECDVDDRRRRDVQDAARDLNAGTTSQGLLSRSGGAIQVLGTPNTPVVFTSWADDTVGGNDDGPSTRPPGRRYGGIVYRDDSDHERDFLSPWAARPTRSTWPCPSI